MLRRLLPSLLLFAGLGHAQTLALYDAGSAGSPPVAPDPTSLNWTHVDPSGGTTTFLPVSPDGTTGLNAWQVDDMGTAANNRGHYQALFTPAELSAAALDGWTLSVTMRPIATNGIDLFFEYASGTTTADDRYLLFFEISGADVVANDFLSGATWLCPGGADGAYHVWEIVKPGGQLDADLVYDGQVIGPVLRANSNPNAPPGGVHWGAGSSGSTMTCNFNRVRFAIDGSLGVNYCGPAALNSTGQPGILVISGSRSSRTTTCG